MALPVPVKTWLISANNTLPSNVGPSDSNGRSRDLADFFGTVVQRLVSLSSSLPSTITVVGSSDAASNVSPPTLSGVNYWVSGSANFRQKMFDYFNSTTSSLWIVLRFGATSQLAMCFERTVYQFSARWSQSGAFAAPTTANGRPVAPDEVLIWSTSSSGYGNFNMSSQGIINSANSYLNYTQQVQIGLASDLSGFYAVSFRAQVPAQVIWFGSLQNAVWTTPPWDWSQARVMFLSGNLQYRQVAGYYPESVGSSFTQNWQPRATLDSNGVYLLPPAIPAASYNAITGGLTYASVANNAIIYNATVDLDTGAFPLSNVSVYSPTRNGLKGVLTDLWFGPANGNTYTYPSSAPLAPNLFQANDFVFPWDGATTILFA